MKKQETNISRLSINRCVIFLLEKELIPGFIFLFKMVFYEFLD